MAARNAEYEIIMGFGALLWLGYVAAMFIVCGIMVFRASKYDYCIVNVPTQAPQTISQ